MSGISGEIMELVWVVLEIEQERRQGGKVDVFEALIADHGERALIRPQPELGLRPPMFGVAEIQLEMDFAPPVLRAVAL